MPGAEPSTQSQSPYHFIPERPPSLQFLVSLQALGPASRSASIGQENIAWLVKETFPLFPLDDVRGFTTEGLASDEGKYIGIFQKLKDLLHLRLGKLDIRPVLDVLSSGNRTFWVFTGVTLIHLHT